MVSPTDFELQPQLAGALVELRPLRADDYAAVYAVASDPLIWEQHPASDRYQEVVFKEFFREAMETKSAFAVLDAKSGTIIGSTRYYGLDPAASEIEIGWSFLARSYWGGHYNGEMKRLMLDHAFRFVDHVVFRIGPNNIRSQKAVEKIGGVRIADRVNAAGQVSVVYRISSTSPTTPPIRSPQDR